MKALRQIYISSIIITWIGIYEYFKWLQRTSDIWDVSNLENKSSWYVSTACLSFAIAFGLAFIYFYKRRHGWDEKPSFILFVCTVLFMFVLNYVAFTIYYIFMFASVS